MRLKNRREFIKSSSIGIIGSVNLLKQREQNDSDNYQSDTTIGGRSAEEVGIKQKVIELSAQNKITEMENLLDDHNVQYESTTKVIPNQEEWQYSGDDSVGTNDFVNKGPSEVTAHCNIIGKEEFKDTT